MTENESGIEETGKDKNEGKGTGKKGISKLHKRLESKVMGVLDRFGDNMSKDSNSKSDEDLNGKVEEKKVKDTTIKETNESIMEKGVDDEVSTKKEASIEKTENKDTKKNEKKEASKKPLEDEKSVDEEVREKEKTKETDEEEKGKDKKAEKKGKEKEPEEKSQKPKETLEELVAHKEEIEALLSSIEDSYRDATLPDNTYHEVKKKNEKKLEEVNKKIKALGGGVALKTSEVEEKPFPASGESTAPVQPVAQAAPQAAPGIKTEKTSEEKCVKLVEGLEKSIEERLKNVIATASVEVTDKRINKVSNRLDLIESDIKEFKKTSETVNGFDKQFNVMSASVEKTKALVEGAKGATNIIDEKIQRLNENFTEIRSMVYQREAISKEQEVNIDKLKDTVSQVDTARILREFTIRDEQIRDVNTRIEKIERSLKMLTETTNKIKGLMTDVGSLENIIKASKHVGEKLEKITEIEERMKANSSRLDGAYVDMKKKLDDFVDYKVKQDKLDGISNDLLKNVEELTKRLTDFATKDDIEGAKKLIENVKESAMEAAKKAAMPPEVAAMEEEKGEIDTLLSMLEDNLKNKQISQEDYDKAKSKNLLKLRDLEEKMKTFKPGSASKAASGGVEESETESRHAGVMLLAKLREAYENGEISKDAYEKGKKKLLKK